MEVYKRDNFICQNCGKYGCYLEAHHKESLSKILEKNKILNIEKALNCNELWNIDNGITLCTDCHSELDEKRFRFSKIKIY